MVFFVGFPGGIPLKTCPNKFRVTRNDRAICPEYMTTLWYSGATAPQSLQNVSQPCISSNWFLWMLGRLTKSTGKGRGWNPKLVLNLSSLAINEFTEWWSSKGTKPIGLSCTDQQKRQQPKKKHNNNNNHNNNCNYFAFVLEVPGVDVTSSFLGNHRQRATNRSGSEVGWCHTSFGCL